MRQNYVETLTEDSYLFIIYDYKKSEVSKRPPVGDRR